MAKNITGAENVRWDLGFLYLSLDDPRLDADAAMLVEMFEKFNVQYKGKLSETLSSAICDLLCI